MEAEIILQYPSTRFARSVEEALSPDNKPGVLQMQISATATGKTLRVLVKNCDRIETLQATLQDIFRCVRAAETSLTKLATG